MNEKVIALAKPFPLEDISFKIQVNPRKDGKPAAKGDAMLATHIDARAAQARLDEVLPLAWSCSYVERRNDKKLVIECFITADVDGKTIIRSDVGESDNADGQASKEKSAYSDAFKRAAVKYGVGAYLYSLPTIWAEAEQRGNSYRITDRGLRDAERVYTEAVKKLGLQNPGEASQGVVEAEDELQDATASPTVQTPEQARAAKTVVENLTPERSGALLAEMKRLGVSEKQALQMATVELDRNVKSFMEITEAEGVKLWRIAKKSYEAANPKKLNSKPIQEREGVSYGEL